MQDSRASGQTGAMELAGHLYDCDWPPIAGRTVWSDYKPGDVVYDRYLKLVETAIRALRAVLPALSPPAIGDGEMREILAEEYSRYNETWMDYAAKLLRENDCGDYSCMAALDAMRRVAERAGASDRWQPIESVPAQYKDEGRELYVCRFGKETAPTYNVVFWDNNIGRWAFAEDMDRSYHPDFPTHWQLPEPPVALHTDEKKGG